MEIELLLVVFFVCAFGKAQILIQGQPTSKIVPSTIKVSKESQLKARLRALQNRFLNKTVDMNEVQQYASVIYRNYTQEMKKSIKLFQQVFEPHLERNEIDSTRKIQKCKVRQEERKMGRGVFPRRVKIGACGASPCSSSDVTCSCQASKIAFIHVIVKHCRRKRGPKRRKTGGCRKKPRQRRRCTWRNNVILSAVACECKCQKN